MKEPCPFCGARIRPIMLGRQIKQCPVCGNGWIESGGGAKAEFRNFGDSGGGAAATAR